MAIAVTRADARHSRGLSPAGADGSRRPARKRPAQAARVAPIRAESDERRRLLEANQRLLASQRAQTDLIANVSHDLRSPLASLREFISILQDGLAGSLTELQREYLGIAMRNADTLTEMIEHLLVVARINQGVYRLVRRRTVMAEILGDDSLLKGARRGRKAVHLRVIVPPTLPEIYADPDRLLEAIRNLVDNAIKYSGESVHITIRAAESPDGKVELSIQDDGPGMEPSTVRSLFRRFYRGRHAGSVNPGGLGLGLSIVKEIVDLHSGRIDVESKPGIGSTFRILLPPFNAKEVLLVSVRRAWAKYVEGGDGFGLLQIGVRRCNGTSPKPGGEAPRAVRDALLSILRPGEDLLFDWRNCRWSCLLVAAGRAAIPTASRRIRRGVAQRVRFHSGIQLEWERESPWIHSDDFRTPDAMSAAIMREQFCEGGSTDA